MMTFCGGDAACRDGDGGGDALCGGTVIGCSAVGAGCVVWILLAVLLLLMAVVLALGVSAVAELCTWLTEGLEDIVVGSWIFLCCVVGDAVDQTSDKGL